MMEKFVLIQWCWQKSWWEQCCWREEWKAHYLKDPSVTLVLSRVERWEWRKFHEGGIHWSYSQMYRLLSQKLVPLSFQFHQPIYNITWTFSHNCQAMLYINTLVNYFDLLLRKADVDQLSGVKFKDHNLARLDRCIYEISFLLLEVCRSKNGILKRNFNYQNTAKRTNTNDSKDSKSSRDILEVTFFHTAKRKYSFGLV